MLKNLFLFFLVATFLANSALAESIQSVSVETECQRIANKLASIGYEECIARQLSLSDGRSVKNAPLLLKEYPPLKKRTPLGKILVVGGIHGDEYASVSVVFKWMKTLDKYHSGLFHWQVIPLANPDGLLQKKSTRLNANGVDLNRNFPSHNWDQYALDYWQQETKKNPRRYPGPKAVSEPETQWLSKQITRFQPDMIVSVHAPYGIIDYDGPNKGPSHLGHLPLKPLGTFPGSLGRYAGVDKNIPVVTIELTYAGIMPSRQQISHIWVDLVRWLKINVPIQSQAKQAKQEKSGKEKPRKPSQPKQQIVETANSNTNDG